MSTESVNVISKSFQALFNDADYFLEQARLLNEGLASGSADSGLPNQKVLGNQRACLRACFISCVAALESFVNIILIELKRREPQALHPDWLYRRQRKQKLDMWALPDKVRFVPVLCNKDLKPPDEYFDENGRGHRILSELIEIRHTLVHGRPVEVKFLIKHSQNRIKQFSNDSPDNFWPETRFPCDINEIAYDNVAFGYRHILSIMKNLRVFLEGQITREFLLEQTIKFAQGNGRIQREWSGNADPKWFIEVMGPPEI